MEKEIKPIQSDYIDVFALRENVIDDYQVFAKSFTKIHSTVIKTQLDEIYSGNKFWPEPLIQINPRYQRGDSVSSLVTNRVLHKGCLEIFRDKETNEPLNLYKHQSEAIAISSSNESYVVTTGTGSGKSLCFFIPIVNKILLEKDRDQTKRTRAIIIYPMNALANSQFDEIKDYLKHQSGSNKVTVARYTGQENSEKRSDVANDPPDILLTNYMMLEYLLTRQDATDVQVINNCKGLQFLALDELHTYRGRQGADVAVLVRRVREMLGSENLLCIGTSATMASEGSLEDKKRLVAQVASKLFATTVKEHNVVSESLERTTDIRETHESVTDRLKELLNSKPNFKMTNNELYSNPLSIWVETKLGIAWSDEDRRWNRAKPMTLLSASKELADATGVEQNKCRSILKEFLLATNLKESVRCETAVSNAKGFFAFKLHQFISGAGNAYSTIDHSKSKVVTVDGQQFLPGDEEVRLYHLHFCRDCGQEYHPVKISLKDGSKFAFARDIEDSISSANEDDEESDGLNEEFGFICTEPEDEEFFFSENEDVIGECYPENWIDFTRLDKLKIKRDYKKHKPVSLSVEKNGKIGSGVKCWFIPGRFRFCLRCKAAHTSASQDRNRLSSLSAEGRSSATTVITSSVLRWMHLKDSTIPIFKRKLLGFTDNVQDAALQAGHFNDFIFVSLLRSAFLSALTKVGGDGLSSSEIGSAMQEALGFSAQNYSNKNEWLIEDVSGPMLASIEKVLRNVLSYRIWFDQKKGWRYTNPNLEDLGLITVKYVGLDDLVNDGALFSSAPDILANASPEKRKKIFEKLFNHLRLGMAVKSSVLDELNLEQMKNLSYSSLKQPWGIANEEEPRSSRYLVIQLPVRKKASYKDDDAYVRGGYRSGLGKLLRSNELWGDESDIKTYDEDHYNDLLKFLLGAGKKYGLIFSDILDSENNEGWRLSDSCIKFYRSSKVDVKLTKSNSYFIDLYTNLSLMMQSATNPLYGFQALAHTANVRSENRKIREKRFRFGTEDQAELKNIESEVKQFGEQTKFLPVMFCSPTMELGVDISSLNTVYLRNTPPTPANYAQRSGRAGRSGQAALVITYCAARSPHDQYFFNDPESMVYGEVKAPALDLSNRDLIESHLHAIWLASSGQPMSNKIAELLMLAEPGRQIKKELAENLKKDSVSNLAISRMRNVLNQLKDELTPEKAPWFPGEKVYAESTSDQSFEKFNKAFDRWRELLLAAEQQEDSAGKVIRDLSALPKEKKAAKSREYQARSQIDLLVGGDDNSNNDFYTYRYLATEGFLPGYNFARLPLMAFVPSVNDGKVKHTYLQRPRFLALSEFGPNSLVYHEGRVFRVVRAILPLSNTSAVSSDSLLVTSLIRICKVCGAAHFEDKSSNCQSCSTSLADADIIKDVYRIDNVATEPAERISANDEERQRRGFDIQTVYQWAIREGRPDKRIQMLADGSGNVAELRYGPTATITRINKGLKRRTIKTKLGFKIDPISGYWRSSEDSVNQTDGNQVEVRVKQSIVPIVQDRKNALYFQPMVQELKLKTMATLQYALLRGIESVYQLEEGEILAEAMPNIDTRTGFLFYEASEGGAGVLNRFISDDVSMAKVAEAALESMHFELKKDNTGKVLSIKNISNSCVAGCYRCIMSYYNQPDHENIDRRDDLVQSYLIRLSNSKRTNSEKDASLENMENDKFSSLLSTNGVAVDQIQSLLIDGVAFKYVWPKHYVVLSVDAISSDMKEGLERKGFEVFDGHNKSDLELANVINKLKLALEGN